MKIFFRNKKGFTLIELLVVVAIISLLSSIVFASLNTARAKARNAKRLQDISSYALAAELAYDTDGEYPDAQSDPTPMNNFCLGNYLLPVPGCWSNNTTNQSVDIDTTLKKYLPALPPGDKVVDWEGYIYNCITRTNGVCSSMQIRWFMEGIDQSCGPGTVLDGNYGLSGATFCKLVR